jgi:hypothetical protein
MRADAVFFVGGAKRSALVVMGPRYYRVTDIISVLRLYMDEKPKLGRPPKPDARVQVSLRLHPDVLAAYVAGGPEWRGRMEAAIIAGLEPKTPKPPSGGSSVKAAPPVRVEVTRLKSKIVNRLKGEWKAP